MDGERTFSQLAAELKQVYGYNATAVCSVYVKHNPLKYGSDQLEKYWEHTRKFLENLHMVLYAKDHQMSLHNIKPESYFFLTKICIDHAFTVTELIDIRNDREQKYAKDMANDIAHHILPPYLTYRRQINYSPVPNNTGPGYIQMAPMPGGWPMPMPMPMMPQMPGWPMPMPMMPQMPGWPMPGWSMPQFQPCMQEPAPVPAPRKVKPIVKKKPTCVRKGEVKVSENLIMPVPADGTDNVPLNFYSVYCSERANIINNSADEHHVPLIFPVPNFPPPPLI